ncbi:hypothetical protein Droror1_Dr00026745, partial [Drosera rotundifolia]
MLVFDSCGWFRRGAIRGGVGSSSMVVFDLDRTVGTRLGCDELDDVGFREEVLELNCLVFEGVLSAVLLLGLRYGMSLTLQIQFFENKLSVEFNVVVSSVEGFNNYCPAAHMRGFDLLGGRISLQRVKARLLPFSIVNKLKKIASF